MTHEKILKIITWAIDSWNGGDHDQVEVIGKMSLAEYILYKLELSGAVNPQEPMKRSEMEEFIKNEILDSLSRYQRVPDIEGWCAFVGGEILDMVEGFGMYYNWTPEDDK